MPLKHSRNLRSHCESPAGKRRRLHLSVQPASFSPSSIPLFNLLFSHYLIGFLYNALHGI